MKPKTLSDFLNYRKDPESNPPLLRYKKLAKPGPGSPDQYDIRVTFRVCGYESDLREVEQYFGKKAKEGIL